MKHKLQDRVIYHLAKHRKTFPVRLASKLARKIIKGVENCSYDTAFNGEEMVLQRLAGMKLEVFFDVSAEPRRLVGDGSASFSFELIALF